VFYKKMAFIAFFNAGVAPGHRDPYHPTQGYFIRRHGGDRRLCHHVMKAAGSDPDQ
jgi:hypothetical protein